MFATTEKVIDIKDKFYIAKENYNLFERLWLKLINDERDLPFIYLMTKCTLLVLPVAIFLYIPGNFTWFVAVPYLIINLGVLMGPFVLMLHNTSHRKLFKKEYEVLNHYIPWFLGPFYGESPETYYYHHVGMHHAENNLAKDLSSTMQYNRDSLGDFGRYFLQFFCFGIFDLSNYFRKKNQSRFVKKIYAGEFSFIAMCILFSLFNWKATLVVFILPFVFVRLAMMMGNWSQHAFIDAADPGNSYKNSITCINTTYNKRCFNDGYHIGHHLRPAMHWTDMPANFAENTGQYKDNGSVVFDGVDYFQIWILLMTKNYKALAEKAIVLNMGPASQQDVMAFLKERTRKITSYIEPENRRARMAATA